MGRQRWLSGRLAWIVGASVLAASCTSLPRARDLACAASDTPVAQRSADGQTDHVQLDVMTYNIEGLSWPARHGRADDLAQIGRSLAALREAGQAPDVVLFQEVFSDHARRAVQATGYPALVAGPSVWERRSLPSDGHVPGRRWKEGELGVKLASGGLAIASRFPIVAYRAEPFSHRSCAGSDCLSNKGALLARIAIPGVPDPVDVFDAHMNSRRISGASPPRTLAAHLVESRELSDFVAREAPGDTPAVLAGDFNMRHSEARFDAFERVEPMTVAQRYCLQAGGACRTDIQSKSATPWLDTEDLQLFRGGRRVDIRPVRVEALFDGRPGSPQLSDHAALRVIYDVSWRPDEPPAAGACPVTPRPTRG